MSSIIKMDRALAERLTLLVAYMANRGGYDDPYSVIRASYEDGGWKDSVGLLFREITKNGYSSIRDVEFKHIIDAATDALKNSYGEEHLPALVSTIVELLQQPYGNNVLAGETLKRLRKAVLFPEEMAKISANAQNELKCATCGKPFCTGEMATFSPGDRGEVRFLCVLCATPTHTSCAKCREGSGPIDHRALAKTLAKSDCGCAGPKAADIPEEVRRGIIEDNPFELIGRDVAPAQNRPIGIMEEVARERQLRNRPPRAAEGRR